MHSNHTGLYLCVEPMQQATTTPASLQRDSVNVKERNAELRVEILQYAMRKSLR